MKRLKILLILVVVWTTNLFSQQQIGDWVSHFSYENPTQVVKGKEKIYVVANNKLFSYNSIDKHIETYSRITGLSDHEIKMLAYNISEECLLVCYHNGNFDLLFSNGKIVNIPNLYQVTANIDKTINGVFSYKEYFYVSTNFGFITLNAEKHEVKETVNFNQPFFSIYRDASTLYAVNPTGVIQCAITENIQDKSKWRVFPVSQKYGYTDYTFSDSEIRKIYGYADRIHFLIPGKAIYYLSDNDQLERVLQGRGIQDVVVRGANRSIAYRHNDFFVANSLDNYKRTTVKNLTSIDFAGNNRFFIITKDHAPALIQPASSATENSYETLASNIKPEGPLTNYPFFMTFEQGKLLVTGGGYYWDRFNNPACLSAYTPDKGWYNYDLAQIKQINNHAYDFCSAVIDPSDSEHIFVTSWGEGVYEFRDGKCVKLYNKSNSTLEDIGSGFNYHRIEGLAYDKDGNLWTTNTKVKNSIKILKKDGKWSKIYYPEIKVTENIKTIFIDRYNHKWCISGHHKTYIFVFDEKGTIENIADDKVKMISNLINQKEAVLPIRYFNCIVEDKTGNIWLGTDNGPLMIYNAADIFSKNVVLNQIVIPRNDGTNYIDYLLEKVPVSSIKVDGANRKWIATSGSGIYLVSSDGTKTIQHFTTENSPMPSNTVLSVAIDETTGIVYIGTDKGIVAYKSDALKPNETFDNVTVYPNPVRPDYSGNIVIAGLKENTVVKITDINANLLKQGQSLGGQFLWDGRNTQGVKVQTGVYLVFGSTEEGEEGMITKIMIIN